MLKRNLEQFFRLDLIQGNLYLTYTKDTDKRFAQLGVHYSTASNRLVKDLLFDFAVKAGHKCYRCNLDLTRDGFSIEHKIEWMDSDDPIDKFFDLDNIAFSHLKCNSSAGRRVLAACGTRAAYSRGCRCDKCLCSDREYRRGRYTPERRRARYDRDGR